jgi:ABC-2 type transport system permease protein
MAHPVSRTNLFFGRLAGFVLATAAILAIGWIGWVIPSQSSGLELSAIELLQPQLPLLAILVLFGTLALLLSMVLPSGRSAGGLTGALLVANFFLIGIATINTDLQPLYEVTPLYFYQGGKAVEGIDWGAFIGLLGVSVVFALIAWWRFQRRDIRVGGEGGWRLSLPAVFQRG